jgi:hypothetical protein
VRWKSAIGDAYPFGIGGVFDVEGLPAAFVPIIRLKHECEGTDRTTGMDRPDSFLRQHAEILRAARKLRGRDREDALQVGWLSAIARGDSTGVQRSMRAFVRYWERGGMTNHADAVSPGVSEAETFSERDPSGREWVSTNLGGWGVVLPPHLAAGDYQPTGRPSGRPPRKAPNAASAKLLEAAGIQPFPDGMAELRSLLNSGRKGRDPRVVKAVVECQEWGAEELARILGCSRQAVNAILRDHRDA